MSAYADEQGYQGDGGETDAELSEILSGDPFGAGQLIFGFTAVLHPERERATFIVRVFDASGAWTRDADQRAFATLHQSVADDG